MHKFKFMRQLEMVSFATSDKIWRIIIILGFFALFNKSKNCAGFLQAVWCARTQKYAKVCVIVGWRGRPLQHMKKQ